MKKFIRLVGIFGLLFAVVFAVAGWIVFNANLADLHNVYSFTSSLRSENLAWITRAVFFLFLVIYIPAFIQIYKGIQLASSSKTVIRIQLALILLLVELLIIQGGIVQFFNLLVGG